MYKKMHFLLVIICYSSIFFFNTAAPYDFTHEPIDVVIPCHKKDKITLDFVIEGAKKNVKNVRRIIVISDTKFSDKAEWFDERNFPFSKETIAYEIFKDKNKASKFAKQPRSRVGWIYQQFLKFYSMFVIPKISSNVLIIDADTVFLKPVSFQDINGAGLYNPGTEYHKPYFAHLQRVLPGFKKVFPKYSGISHHMLFQRSVINEIYSSIKEKRGEPWKAFCAAIDKKELRKSCMCVEYELYFNYVFAHSDQVKIRHLKWLNVKDLDFEKYRKQGYDYVSAHAWMRK